MRATCRSVADYNTTLSSDSLESGTGSSNSLRSTIQSAFPLWRNAREEATRRLGSRWYEGLRSHEGMKASMQGRGSAKVRDFARALEKADVAVFFYAGHGLQASGRN